VALWRGKNEDPKFLEWVEGMRKEITKKQARENEMILFGEQEEVKQLGREITRLESDLNSKLYLGELYLGDNINASGYGSSVQGSSGHGSSRIVVRENIVKENIVKENIVKGNIVKENIVQGTITDHASPVPLGSIFTRFPELAKLFLETCLRQRELQLKKRELQTEAATELTVTVAPSVWRYLLKLREHYKSSLGITEASESILNLNFL
jgi:hypothetical protein